MARASLKPCMTPGCPTLHSNRGGRCDVHGKKNEQERQAYLNANRPTSTGLGYDREWQRFRSGFLAENPVCVDCGGQANQVDHVNSVRDHPELRLSYSNCRAMCARCHSRRTARDQGFARRSPKVTR